MVESNNTRNTTNSLSNLVIINVIAQTPLKLTSSNYLLWKLQFQTLFTGYDLQGFIDGSKPCPSQQLATDNSPNPAYHAWIRQDLIILHALLGSIHHTIIPFIAQAATSQEA